MRVYTNQQSIKLTQNLHYMNPFFAENNSNGYITIIDQNSILQKNYVDDNLNVSHIMNKKIKNSIDNNKGTKVQISMKKQLKLFKIMAVKQRRSQFRQISDYQNEQYENNNKHQIEIVSRVYDQMTNEFEKMCKYYALIKSEDFNINSNDHSLKSSNLKYNAFSQQNELSTQFLDKENQQFMKKEDQNLYTHYKNDEESDSSFSPNIRKKIIYCPIQDQVKQRNQNFKDYQNLMKNYQKEGITSVNQKSLGIVPKESKRNNILNFSQNNNLKSISNEKYTVEFTQNLKKQQQSRKILYDSSSSEEDIIDKVKKCHKTLNDRVQEKISESIHLNTINQQHTRLCKSQLTKQLEIYQKNSNYGNNNCSNKSQTSSLDGDTQFQNHQNLKEEFNNYPVLPNVANQQCLKNQFLKLDITDQESASKEKQSIVCQQLQLLLQDTTRNIKNTKEDALSILQKCIFITQASHAHSIMQSLLNNFESISQMNKSNNELNSSEAEIEEDETAADLKKKEVSSPRLFCRASTNLSRSSMSTQPLINKQQSTPSISNIMETSSACAIGFENIKVEIAEINNILNCDKAQQIKDNQTQYQLQQQEQQSLTKLILEKKETSDCIYEKSLERGLIYSSSGNKQNYISHCQKFFKLKNLTKSQQHQFRFSQYKKKTNQNLSSSYPCSNLKNASNDEVCNNITSNVSKFGKFHNYNKLFMYNVLNMFQPNNLANMNIPEVISKELQLLISRIKTSAKNNYKVEGKYAFDYFSHAHYNVLFLQLTPENIDILSKQDEYVHLYQTCYNLDLTENISSITMTYINIIKLYCYQIFIECIKEEEIKVDNSLTQENLKNQYTLKVIKGVRKLSQGLIIKRF